MALGAAGLAVMGVRGVSHGHGGHSHGGRDHHAGAGHAHGTHAHGGHAHAAHSQAHGHAGHGPGSASARALSLLSPRILFSFLLGMGTAGVVLRPLGTSLTSPLLFAVAVAAGVAFERLFVTPLWNFMFRFESTPALTLEAAVEDEAKAVTNFDGNGQGLISLELDGQFVQCLGTLCQEDRLAGIHVRAGDVVRIQDVDADRNRCTVRRL
jgi:translation initiation factor IF-1